MHARMRASFEEGQIFIASKGIIILYDDIYPV
jgi:hypothetical protein